MRIKILFDKETSRADLHGGWGIAYMAGDSVLFDTGENGPYLLHNMQVLGVDVKRITKVVISHNHWDHQGGLIDFVRGRGDIEIYGCQDLVAELEGKVGHVVMKHVAGLEEVAKDIYTTGCMATGYKGSQLYEQALVVKTKKGISCLCGCAHPGVLAILSRVKELFPQEKIYSVCGGFHLMSEEERVVRYIAREMKKTGVEKVGPSHCTGYEAMMIFKEVYGEKCFCIHAGEDIEL